MPSISIAPVQWTPEDAREALATQTRNRPLSKIVTRKYRNDMAAGRWGLNGSTICFDDAGRLIDGQHRLTAHADLEGVVIEYIVIRGLNESSQLTMDQGRARSVGQQLQLTGVPNGNTVGAGVKVYLTLKTGLMFRDSKVAQEVITNSLVEQWAGENRGTIDALNESMTAIRSSDAPPSVAYAAALLMHEKSPELTAEFFRLLAHGAGGSDHPITVLDKRLQRHRREGIKISTRDTLALFLQSWNAWRKGAKLTKFQRPRGGHWTEATFPKAAA